jgi:hypothetical protein
LVQVSSSTTPFTNLSDLNGQSGTHYLSSAVEPYIAVDPRNPLHLVGVWQQDRWSNGGCRGILAADSTDGGNTWSVSEVTGMTVNEGGTTLRASDPWVSFSPNGTVYVAALVLNDPNVQTPQGVDVSKSTNGGLTWGAATELINTNNNSLFNDKDSLTADPTNSNYVYAVWDQLNFNSNSGPTFFARTTDGGQTWATAGPIYDPGSGFQTLDNQIVVQPNGTLIDMFVLINYSNNAETIEVIRSTDHGSTWSSPTAVSPLQQVYEHDPDTGAPVRAGDIPDIAVNRRNGNLYVVFQSGTFSGFTHDDIALSYSTDGGQTWSAPRRVNHTPTNIPVADQQAFTPNVAVANNGTIAVGYYDFRNNTPAAGALTDYWLVTLSPSAIQLGKKGQERRMTTTSFDIEQAPNANGLFLGDYEGLVAMGTKYNSFGAFFAIANNSSNPTNIFFRDPGRSPQDGAGQDTLGSPGQTHAVASNETAPPVSRAAAIDLAFDQSSKAAPIDNQSQALPLVRQEEQATSDAGLVQWLWNEAW